MMRLGRKKDKDKEEKDKDKEKKEKKDKKEKKEKRKSLSTKKPSSSSSKKRTIKAKIEIHPQAISNLPIDLNNSILFLSWKRGAKKSNRGESKRVQVSNGRCVWGDDQPAIPIQATFVQYKGKFTDKKLQLTLHSQVDKKVGHKVSEWELHLCEYAADGTDKSINLANTGKSSNPSIFTARLLTTWLKIDNKTIVTKTGDDYDLASETDGSDTEGDTSIESDMESDMSDMSDDDDDDDDEVDMDDDGKIKFVDKGKGGSKIEMKRGSKIIPAADPKKDEHDKHEKEEKEKKEKEREEKEKKEREEKEKKEKEERERKEQEEKERLAKEKEKEKEKEELEKKEKEEKEKKAAAAAATAAAPGLKDSRTMPTAGQETYGLCKSLYSWKGEKEGDLSFAAGEIIQITSKNERWWEGTAKSGQKGTFPKNYVAEISESDEAKASSAASSFTAVPTRPPPGPAPVAGPAGLPPPPAFSRPGFAPRTPPVATPLTPPASLVTPATPTPAPSTPTPAPTTPSPPVSGVVSPPYSPPGRVAPPVPSQADKEKREREERERKEKEDKEKREREEQEKARKLKEEQEKRDKEEREKKEKEEKERKEREEKEKKEREEREGTRKGRLEGARAMFERGSAAPAPAPAVDHAKAAEERKAKIFQTGSLGARIESLGSKKSDTQPTPAAQPAAATTAALGSRTSHGAEEPKGTNASGQPPAKANGAVVDSAAAAEQERKLHELQRKLDEASADNKKLKSEKEERVRELEGKTKELERMLADKNQEIWNLREDKTAAAASKDMGEQLAKLRAEAEAERKGWQKKVEDMERDAAKLREEKDRVVAQLKEEKDRELARMGEEKDRAVAQLKEEKDREIARLREEKAAAEKRLVGDGEPSTGKTQELQRMLADKNQEIWDLREALEKREKESAQAAAKSDRDWKDRSERDAREAKAAGDRAQELSKRSGEQADELARLRSALESKDRELSELREKSRAPSPTASPRMPAINPAEFELQRKQLEALRQQVSKAREDNNALSQKLSDKDREIREEKRVSESLREDIQRAERDKADLRAAADRERAERERRERDLRSREGSENSEMAGLRTEINRVLEEKRGLTITLDGQRGEINKLQDELRARQKKIDDLKEEVNDLKEEIRDKDEEMDKLKGELDERLREAERLKGHVEEHSDKVEKLREELTIKTGELIERERADKTEVGKENLLQQKTTKLEKMVRDMHVELNVKKQSLKKAIKQSEQKEMEIRRLKDKVENLKRQLDEMESGKKDSESDSESESEDEDSGTKKKKKSKKSKDDDDDDDDDDDKDDGKNLKKTLKKLEIKKDVLKQRLEKLDMVEKTILAVEVRRKDEGRGGADRDDSDDEREPGDGGDAIEVAQDLFWFLEKNGLFDKDHTDQHLLNHVIDALDATLERCVGNTEHQAYYLSLVSTLIQSIILDKEKMEPFRVDEDLVEACAAMREDGIGVIDERRARELEQKQKCAAMKANNSAEVDIDRRPAAMGSGGEGGGRGRGGPPPDMSGGGRGRGGYPPDGRGRGGGPAYDSPNRGRGGPPSRGGRGDFAGGPPPGAGPGRGRGGGPDYGPMGDSGGRGRGGAPGWDEPRRPSEGGGGRGRGGPPAFSPNASDDEEDGGARTRDEPPVAPAPKKPKRAELRRSATGESLLSSFLRRLYFVAERIFLEMHARVVDAVAPLLIPAILSHPNPGSSIGPPKPGGPRVQHLPSPAEMSGGGSDRLPPTEQDVTRHLDVVFTQLSSHSVFPAIMQQFASVVYYSLNVVLLNVVLKRPELCTCSNGFKMKWGLARLTSWLYKSDSDPFVFPRPAEIEDQLQHITEAATLLVMDKAVFAKPQAVRRQFVELSGPQLRALLFNFRPDAMAPEKVAEEWKKTAAMMASHEGGPLLLADPLLGPMRG